MSKGKLWTGRTASFRAPAATASRLQAHSSKAPFVSQAWRPTVSFGSMFAKRWPPKPMGAAPSSMTSEHPCAGGWPRPRPSSSLTSSAFLCLGGDTSSPLHFASLPLHFRLVSEVKRLKGALRGGLGAAAAPAPAPGDQLAALVQALATVVSLLHERRHEQLVKELLDTPLWQVPQVGVARRALGGHTSHSTARCHFVASGVISYRRSRAVPTPVGHTDAC